MGVTWSIRSNAALCATIRQAAETETTEAKAVMVAARHAKLAVTQIRCISLMSHRSVGLEADPALRRTIR